MSPLDRTIQKPPLKNLIQLVRHDLLLIQCLINRRVLYKSSEMISKLYRSYVRTYIEYCIQFWTPIDVKDADALKGYREEQFFKMIPSLRNLSY